MKDTCIVDVPWAVDYFSDRGTFRALGVMLDAHTCGADIDLILAVCKKYSAELAVDVEQLDRIFDTVIENINSYRFKLIGLNIGKWAYVGDILPPCCILIYNPIGAQKDICRLKGEYYYTELGMSTADIAKLMNSHQSYIQRLLKGAGVELRPPSNNWGDKNGASVDSPLKDPDVFFHHYVELDKGLGTIAREFNVSKRFAARWRRRHKIKPHGKSDWHQRNLLVGDKNPNWKDLRCLDCNSKLRESSTTRCRSCYFKYNVGPNNVHWKGGPSDVLAGVRQWTGTVWRKSVMERDGFECKRCGDDRGGNLHAHHIKRLSVLVRECEARIPADVTNIDERIRWVISQPEIQDLDNGVTLCKPCHQRVHRGKQKDIITVF